jgi:hypothetical protein
VFLAVDLLVTLLLGWCATFVGGVLFFVVIALLRDRPIELQYNIEVAWAMLTDPFTMGSIAVSAAAAIWFIPAFFGRLWLIAYVTSGLLLKCAKGFDFGFGWFNRRFDVENHALQSIGVVAGTLFAVAYWLLATIHLLP